MASIDKARLGSRKFSGARDADLARPGMAGRIALPPGETFGPNDDLFTFQSFATTGGSSVSFNGGNGDDTLQAVFGADSASLGGDRVTTSFQVHQDGSFTATYATNRTGNNDSVTVTNVENISITLTNMDSSGFTYGIPDEIRTGFGDDTISTAFGDDIIDSGTGVDIVDGGAGIDGIAKDFSAETGAIRWNLVADTFTGPGDFTNLDYFIDLKTGSGKDVIVTSDVVAGFPAQSADLVATGAGKDRASFFRGNDSYDGGDGSDRLIIDYSHLDPGGGGVWFNMTGFSEGPNGVYSGAIVSASGTHSVTFAEVEHFTITVNQSADQVETGDGDDSVSGLGGNDRILIGSGKDSADGGAGIDGIAKDFSTATQAVLWDLTANSFSGSGSFTDLDYFIDLETGAGNDVIATSHAVTGQAAERADLVATGAGDDSAAFFTGNDTFDGGAGSDRLTIDYSHLDPGGGGVWFNMTGFTEGPNGVYSGAIVSASGTHSVTFAKVEHFTITVNQSADQVETGDGDDSVSGLGGDDRILVGSGKDSVDGGAGADGIAKDFSAATGAIRWDLTANSFSGSGAYTNLDYFIDLATGGGDDVIVTSHAFVGQPAHGADLVATGAGDDSAAFFRGNDTYDGGSGSDRLIIDYSGLDGGIFNTTGFTEGPNGVYSGVFGNTSTSVTFSNVEHFTITAKDVGDQIETGDGDDSVSGLGGADTIVAGAGDDVLEGGADADSLNGGSGIDAASHAGAAAGVRADLATPATNTGDAAGDSYAGIENLIGSGFADLLFGNGQANALDGGGGNDALDGRGGNDTLIGGKGKDSLTGGTGADEFRLTNLATGGADTILDFGAGDAIGLDSDVFGLPEGALAASRFVIGGAAGDANDRLIYNDANGKLFFDADGTGAQAQVLIATLSGAPTLAAADFIVI